MSAETVVGAFHRVGQPRVQRELCGLADYPAEHEQSGDRHPRLGVETEQRCSVLDGRLGGDDERLLAGEGDRPERRRDGDDADQEEVVAEAGDEERLLRGRGGRLRPEPEPDQQVRTEADEFEEHERHQQVVRVDEREHAEREEPEAGVVPRKPGLSLVVHVSEAEDVNEEGDQRDDDQHQRRQRIDQQAEGEGDLLGADLGRDRAGRPLVERLVIRFAARDRREHPQREQQRGCRREDTRNRALLRQLSAEDERDDERREREQCDRRSVTEWACTSSYHLTTSSSLEP